MASSSSTTLEVQAVPLKTLPPLEHIESKPSSFWEDNAGPSASRLSGTHSSRGRRLGELDGDSPPPAGVAAVEVVQRWNNPRSNIPRIMAAFWSLLVMGANDAAYGAIIPYLQDFYHLEYALVSLVFLSPFVGYTASALLNETLHRRYGQRGIAIISSVCHATAYVVVCLHPPYAVLVIVFMLAGFGNGVGDAAWNAWVSGMANATEVLGFLHALYGVGAVISPLIATAMITRAGLEWYRFYYVMVGLATIEIVASTTSFWKATAEEYRNAHPAPSSDSGETRTRMRDVLLRNPGARVTWICAAFLICYVGVEVSLGGWIVEFMIKVRQGEAFASGMAATGFWLGLTVGRVVLGFITPLIGERVALMIYIPVTMALELFFWLIPQFYVSAVAVALQGFFLGPLFPSAVVAATKLLPKHLHVSAIGFMAAFGASGAAVLPFAVGAIAQSKGVQVLQPIVLAILVVLLLLWLCLPKFGKKRE